MRRFSLISALRGFPTYFLKASLWALLLYYFSNAFATKSFWAVSLGVYVFSLPIALSGIYSSTVSQAQRLEGFAHRGSIFRLLSGRLLKVIYWVSLALMMAFAILLHLHSYESVEWILLVTIIPMFWFCFQLSLYVVNSEYKTYLATSKGLRLSRWLCATVMTILSVLLSMIMSDAGHYASAGEAIEARRLAVQSMTGSALILEAFNWMAIYWGVKDYAFSRLSELDGLATIAVVSLGSFVLFYQVSAMLSSFLIGGDEYRRVFGPLSSSDEPEPVPPRNITIAIAITVFISLFVYLPLSTYLEAWAQQSPRVAAWRNEQARLVIVLEQIDNAFFQEGTIAALDQARMDALTRVDVSLESFNIEADIAFDQLALHVDDYLDWYYSLSGEYARIGNLLIGELEEFMTAKLTESLMQGDPFKKVENALNSALAEHAQAQQFYEVAAARIMDENRVNQQDASFRVVRSISLADALQPPLHDDVIQLETRLLTSMGGGTLGGGFSAFVVKKVIGKIISKNMFKLGATALGKVVLSKSFGAAGGVGAGASAGAIVGSAVPGIGTLIGSLVGGFVGAIVAGLTVDKTLIELEEFISRDQFKQEMRSAIEEARVEFKGS